MMMDIVDVVCDALADCPSIVSADAVDRELLESSIRLSTGMFTGRLHIESASYGDRVNAFSLTFSTPVANFPFGISVDRRGKKRAKVSAM